MLVLYNFKGVFIGEGRFREDHLIPSPYIMGRYLLERSK